MNPRITRRLYWIVVLARSSTFFHSIISIATGFGPELLHSHLWPTEQSCCIQQRCRPPLNRMRFWPPRSIRRSMQLPTKFEQPFLDRCAPKYLGDKQQWTIIVISIQVPCKSPSHIQLHLHSFSSAAHVFEHAFRCICRRRCSQ